MCLEYLILYPDSNEYTMIKLDNSFLRCHKSYAVNLKYAVDLLKYKIVMSDGTKVPVSRNYYDNVKKMIFKHKASKIGL